MFGALRRVWPIFVRKRLEQLFRQSEPAGIDQELGAGDGRLGEEWGVVRDASPRGQGGIEMSEFFLANSKLICGFRRTRTALVQVSEALLCESIATVCHVPFGLVEFSAVLFSVEPKPGTGGGDRAKEDGKPEPQPTHSRSPRTDRRSDGRYSLIPGTANVPSQRLCEIACRVGLVRAGASSFHDGQVARWRTLASSRRVPHNDIAI